MLQLPRDVQKGTVFIIVNMQSHMHTAANLDCISSTSPHALTAIFWPDVVPSVSFPSQNRGNSLPGMKWRSTLSLEITHIRIQPPDDPSRDMANARAEPVDVTRRNQETKRKAHTVFDKFDCFRLAPPFSKRRIAISVHICGSGT